MKKPEQKWIERFAWGAQKNGNAGAGTYQGGKTTTLTANMNCIVTGVAMFSYCYDSVTNQGIEFVGRVQSSLSNNNNPAFDAGTLFWNYSSSFMPEIPFWFNMGPGDSFDLITLIDFLSVTANIINYFQYCYVRYLAPEDYLNVEAFASPPVTR